MKSLVVMPNWVGDTVMALPVLAALGDTDRALTVLTRPHLRSLLEGQPGVDDILVRAPSWDETISDIKRAGFDEGVVLPNSFRSAWTVFRAGVPRRWGYGSRRLEGILRSLVLRPAVGRGNDRSAHQVEDYVPLLAAMQVREPPDWRPRLVLSGASLESGSALLRRARIDVDRTPLIGLFAGAEFGPSKRWPWRRFAELAGTVRKGSAGSQQIILAGPNETWLAVRIHEESGRIHPVVGPDLDLGQLASVISHLDLLITNDSGPMHMAAALEVPCLALFGPTDPLRTGPVGTAHEVLYTGRWCSPCFRRRCPLLHHRCMRDLSVEEATRHALAMLTE